MRDETSEWLAPMLSAADLSSADLASLMDRAAMPSAEADDSGVEGAAGMFTGPGVTVRGIDWVRVGTLLRHDLGWDDTYPAFPDFPETRQVP